MYELHSKFLFAWDGRAIKRIQSAGPQAHSSPTILSIWQSKQNDPALYASLSLFPHLCGDKTVKMILSLPEISDSGWSLTVLENQEKKNKALKVFFCTLLFLKAFAQAKEFINVVFVLKWRPLETSWLPRLEKWRKNGGVLQYAGEQTQC